MLRLFICLILIYLLSACNLQQNEPTLTAVDAPPATSTTVAIEPTSAVTNPVAATSCYFSAYGIGAPFDAYDTPSSDGTIVGIVDAGVPFAVISQNDLWYQIALSDGVAGWIRQGVGGLSGECDNIPTTSNRPPVPDGVCTVYFDSVTADDLLYTDQNGGEVVAAMVAGEYLVVEARGQSTGYRVRLSDGRTGWLLTPVQLLNANRALNGSCDTLPVEQPAIIGG
jgi:hypothetical protein